MAKRTFDDIFGASGSHNLGIFQPTTPDSPVQAAAAVTGVAGSKPALHAKKHKKNQTGRVPSSAIASENAVIPEELAEKEAPQRSTGFARKPKGEKQSHPAAISCQVTDSRAASKPAAIAVAKAARPAPPRQSLAALRTPKNSTGGQTLPAASLQPTGAGQGPKTSASTEATAADAPEEKLSPAQRKERLDRTVFVGNIQAETKPKVLKAVFSRYGKVESVRLRSIPVKLDAAMPRRAAVLTGKVDAARATAHAYIVFSTPEEAKAALVHNMQLLDGLHMRVDSATGAGSGTASAGSYNKSRSIFVGNLHFAAQDEELVRLFSNGALDPQLQDAVTAVRVVRDSRTNIGKGIAFVEFNSKSAAAAALRLKDVKLEGRPLRISFLKTPKPGSAAPPATSTFRNAGEKVVGTALAKGRIQKRQQVAQREGSKKPSWAGTRAKKVVLPRRSVPAKKLPPGKKVVRHRQSQSKAAAKK